MGPARPGRLQERQGLLVQPDGQLRRPRRLLEAIPVDRATRRMSRTRPSSSSTA
ncbi:MAG: hypothetical protein M0C28_13815 [Candidatus Moduliflexus flocculans]|nr:hypothetical protein [Candidatus Moduliflexus flocculans]